MATLEAPHVDRGAPLAMPEFVALIAALMALGALGIDTILPALPAIGDSLHVANPNHRQFVITIFGAGFGAAQIVHGPLADRYGRRRLLLVAIAAYVVANILAAVSQSFTLLLAARFFSGCVVAATRVATVALVRDCFSGRAMAKTMSLAQMVFMAVPIVAPALGAAILWVGDWRTIFWLTAGVGALLMVWIAWRLPETLDPADRRPIAPRQIAAGWRIALSDRLSLGYTLGSVGLVGALYGYLGSIEQVMADTFGRPRLLIVVFAAAAALMAVANLVNARLVMRLGTRRISHGAALVMIATAAIHLAVIRAGLETIVLFTILQSINLACFALVASNYSALAMERMGHIAGTASSVQGFMGLTIGSALGAVIGQSFDGTAAPLTTGFLLAAIGALVAALVVERGRLFRAA